MTQLLAQGQRRARVRHQCFHCYRDIVPGQTYNYQTCKYDYVYTLATHPDCDGLASMYRKENDCYYDSDEGSPPIMDEFAESGEAQDLLNAYRGFYPHAVTRMELGWQLSAQRREANS